jgi:predicted alpha/beta hydrolase family esterase
MKRQVLFVQGGGEDAHDSWDDKLVESLEQMLGSDYHVAYPRMPEEEKPQFQRWSHTLRREFDTLADGAVLVAHSLGATILLP